MFEPWQWFVIIGGGIVVGFCIIFDLVERSRYMARWRAIRSAQRGEGAPLQTWPPIDVRYLRAGKIDAGKLRRGSEC